MCSSRRRPSAIPYIEKDGTAWINERNCMACHYAGYMLWSFHDAGERGFSIDKGKLAESTNWAMSQTDVHGSARRRGADVDRPRSIGPERNTVKRIESMRDFIIKARKKTVPGSRAASSPPRSGRFPKRRR